jgi:hypothetical protein
MKRALRNRDTTLFLDSDGRQTASIDLARCFASYDDAVAFCKAKHLTGVELVAQMDDKSEMTMAIPQASADAIKFSSTPDSAARGEITTLAIIETVVAMSLSLLFVILFQTSAHIVFGALIAPFLLLRSETSSAAAFKIFDPWFSQVPQVAISNQGIAAASPFAFRFIWLPLVAIAATVAKIVATAATLISSPRETLGAIPANWLRIALATDYKHPPELLPSADTDPGAPASVQAFRYEELRRSIISGPGGNVIQKLSLFALYAPAFLYRLALKSTSLVYFPLIWVSEVPLTVKGILTSPLERVRRWYAAAVIFIMLTAFVIRFDAPNILPTAQDEAVFMYVLSAGEFGFWHLTRALAIAVTIALYFYARKLRTDSVKHPERQRSIIKRANRARAVFALCTLACFLLIVLAL